MKPPRRLPAASRRQWLKLAATAALLPALPLAAAETPPLRLGVTDLSFHRATAAVVVAVLTRLGYRVQRSYALHEANFERLRNGDIDLLASAWLPYSHGVYQNRVHEVVTTRELGLHYQPYALWGVPDYVPADVVGSVADLLKPEVRQRMTPLIQGIGPGAGITRFSLRMMDEYGLSAAGYRFQTGTQQQCFDAFEQAVAAQRWVVVPLWHPQFLHARYRIRELQDPKGLLGGTDRAVLLARSDRLSRLTPAQLQVLDNIRLDNRIVATLDYAINREGQSEDQAAEAWLAAHPDTLAGWLRPTLGS